MNNKITSQPPAIETDNPSALQNNNAKNLDPTFDESARELKKREKLFRQAINMGKKKKNASQKKLSAKTSTKNDRKTFKKSSVKDQSAQGNHSIKNTPARKFKKEISRQQTKQHISAEPQKKKINQNSYKKSHALRHQDNHQASTKKLNRDIEKRSTQSFVAHEGARVRDRMKHERNHQASIKKLNRDIEKKSTQPSAKHEGARIRDQMKHERNHQASTKKLNRDIEKNSTQPSAKHEGTRVRDQMKHERNHQASTKKLNRDIEKNSTQPSAAREGARVRDRMKQERNHQASTKKLNRDIGDIKKSSTQPSAAQEGVRSKVKQNISPDLKKQPVKISLSDKEMDKNKDKNKNDATAADMPKQAALPGAAAADMNAPLPGGAMPAESAPAASAAELTAFIEKASRTIQLSRGDGAQETVMRFDLQDDILPQTQLTAQKLPDGSLSLTFTTDHPEAAALLQQVQSQLVMHMKSVQQMDVQIKMVNTQGRPILEEAGQSRSRQNADEDQKQNAQLDWESVEERMKESQK